MTGSQTHTCMPAHTQHRFLWPHKDNKPEPSQVLSSTCEKRKTRLRSPKLCLNECNLLGAQDKFVMNICKVKSFTPFLYSDTVSRDYEAHPTNYLCLNGLLHYMVGPVVSIEMSLK